MVLLYGSESWVLPDAQLARLEGFHVECARRLTGMRLRKRGDKWIYPKFADVLRAARLQPLRYYIHAKAEGQRSGDHRFAAHPEGV